MCSRKRMRAIWTGNEGSLPNAALALAPRIEKVRTRAPYMCICVRVP
jgi:hypothetical protein